MPHPQGNLQPAGSATRAGEPAVSLIIPAYNEAQRLPPYLRTIRDYIDRECPGQWEVLVIDDGSSDGMADVLAEPLETWAPLRLIRHGQNLGKGAAVRTGVLVARGDYLLYADADGATPIDQQWQLRRAIEQGADIAVGSRLLRAPGVTRRRSWGRALVGRTFASTARKFLHIPVRDTQCGFKMLRSGPAKRLFELSQEKGYLFDLEILALAYRCGYRVTEVPINWFDQPNSRLKLHRDGGKILVDLLRVRRHVANIDLAASSRDES